MSGTVRIEWVDTADVDDPGAGGPNFGYFETHADPPLDRRRLVSLLRMIADDLEAGA
jgi:hypothetical protein